MAPPLTNQIVLPGAVIPALHFWGEAPLRSLEFRVLLGVVVFMRWVMMIYTLRTNRIVGTAIMSILSSMMTCLPFVIVLFSFICGVWNLYLAFGILNPPDSLSVVWRMIVLGDIDLWEMDGLPNDLSPARSDDTVCGGSVCGGSEGGGEDDGVCAVRAQGESSAEGEGEDGGGGMDTSHVARYTSTHPT